MEESSRMLVSLLVAVLLEAVMFWKIFEKAGRPGWASIVPLWNVIVLLQVVREPLWRIILLFIPVVNIIYYLYLCYAMARAFDKEILFAVGIAVLPVILLPVLGFGPARYVAGQTMPQTREELNATLWIAIKGGSHLQYVKDLIVRGADVDARGENGMTPLVYAAQHGRLKLMTVLWLCCHADIDARDNKERTAILHAASVANLEAIDFLTNTDFRKEKAKEFYRENPDLYTPL